jgi:glycerol-3-phosphate dehydrogenase
MIRDPSGIAQRDYDLVIVGGGIYGVCAAWDATLRGLSVAIVDRGDFGGVTSANSLKVVHGGFRYIQQAGVRQMRESMHEFKVLLHIAPHLVRPMPFVIPTFGHGMRGKEVLALGLFLYNLITFDRNRDVNDSQRRIPRGGPISKDELQRLFPEIRGEGLTGAVVFYDGQMYNPPRLLLSFLRSAVNLGAQACNYLEVREFLRGRSGVAGVRAKDVLTGSEVEIQGKMVLNAAGPWAGELLRCLDGRRLDPPLALSKSFYLVVDRPLTRDYALAVPSRHRDPNAIVSRGRRHLFIIPWREHTLVGSSHLVYEGVPDEFAVTEQEMQELLDELNECYPPCGLTRQDVSFCNAGLVPMYESEPGSRDVRLAKDYRIVDHAQSDGVDGLVSMVGVRFTTARLVAEKAVDLVARKLGRRLPDARTAVTPLYGGEIADVRAFVERESRAGAHGLSADVLTPLVRNYGTAYPEVLRWMGEDRSLSERMGSSNVIGAEVVHAVREEMAQKLADVVFRRTELGTAAHPGESALRTGAALMAAELGWNHERVRTELDEVRRAFP